MDTSIRFGSSPKSESDAKVVEGPFSRFYYICGMAAVLAGSQPYGLHYLVSFGDPGLCLVPQKFGGSEAVVAAWVGSIVGESVTAYGLEFSEAFDAVY